MFISWDSQYTNLLAPSKIPGIDVIKQTEFDISEFYCIYAINLLESFINSWENMPTWVPYLNLGIIPKLDYQGYLNLSINMVICHLIHSF